MASRLCWRKQTSNYEADEGLQERGKRLHSFGRTGGGVKSARKSANWKQVGGQQIWSSLACEKDHCLNSHADANFFHSITTIVSIDRCKLDAQVCSHFVFAEQGVAAALRPGDMPLFDPLHQHCLSSCTSECANQDMFCLSSCLKMAVVGKNDNTLPLTTIKKALLS
jgi:hypothetical protein